MEGNKLLKDNLNNVHVNKLEQNITKCKVLAFGQQQNDIYKFWISDKLHDTVAKIVDLDDVLIKKHVKLQYPKLRKLLGL